MLIVVAVTKLVYHLARKRFRIQRGIAPKIQKWHKRRLEMRDLYITGARLIDQSLRLEQFIADSVLHTVTR